MHLNLHIVSANIHFCHRTLTKDSNVAITANHDIPLSVVVLVSKPEDSMLRAFEGI